jgi:hypothetical protein
MNVECSVIPFFNWPFSFDHSYNNIRARDERVTQERSDTLCTRRTTFHLVIYLVMPEQKGK